MAVCDVIVVSTISRMFYAVAAVVTIPLVIVNNRLCVAYESCRIS